MIEKSIYTPKLGEIIARKAKGNDASKYHVVHILMNKWAVVSHGSLKPVKAFTTQDEAVSFAKQYATSKSAGEIVVHGIDGRIMSRLAV